MQTKFFEQTTEHMIETGEIQQSIESIMNDAATSLKNYDLKKAESYIRYAFLISRMSNTINNSLSSIFLGQSIYVVSSLFLRDCFNYLNKKPVESLHLVTGPQIGSYSILDRMIDICMDVQNVVTAKGEECSVRKELIQLSEYDHKLHGCFHIHPGNGVISITPSQVDWKLQSTFDRGGYKSIGAIFSRDGYVRFYGSHDFTIQIYGKGVEIKDEKIYQLTEIS